jgi:hypothetical protein
VPGFAASSTATGDQLQTVNASLMKMLTRQGVLVEEMGPNCMPGQGADGKEAQMLQPLQAAAVTWRIAFTAAPGRRRWSSGG